MTEELKYQYWMKSIPGIGNKKQKKLVEYCGSAREVYHLTEKQLLSVYGIREKDALGILESKKTWQLEREAENLAKKGIFFISMEEADFPEKIAQISDGPYAFFYKGKLPGREKTAAIVGARNCSSYGKSIALSLGQCLAARGVQVISGMAAGIDSFGHWGAIKGGGSTFAVLGCGVDVCYPRGAFELYERILEKGGVISEYLPGTMPAPGRFPMRNRLISGFSDIVILAEAKEKSGSLITADFALEQGKDIYAVPGRLDDELSRGCNRLIYQGAGIILSPEELLADLGFSAKNQEGEKQNPKKVLEKEELLVYSCFGLHSKTLEELVLHTGLNAEVVTDLLVKLMMKGMIEEELKNRYRKV
ncbi:MAG: DNA-processing protein DprA [Roseburia sp.]|nr:DNA-processing protein DprA [Roseburia sp.]